MQWLLPYATQKLLPLVVGGITLVALYSNLEYVEIKRLLQQRQQEERDYKQKVDPLLRENRILEVVIALKHDRASPA